MPITDLYWRRYRIPFRRTFTNRYADIKVREGALLFLETADGMRGIGEVAPLDGFGGTLDAALALLARARPALIGLPVEEAAYWELSGSIMGWGGAPDSVRVVLSGLCCAFFDLIARQRGESLGAYLARGQPLAAHIPVNATLGGLTIETLQWEAERAVARGFHCVKMKVGRGSIEVERERVAAVRAVLGDDITLRVDANGAWEMEFARQILPKLIDAGVAMVEQPLPRHHRVGMRLLREQFPSIQIGADESIVDINSAEDVLRTAAADVLIIKPMLVGGPVDGAMIARRAIQKGRGVIVTSMLESGIGISAALQVAATLPDPVLPCGLATAELLEGTLVKATLQAEKGLLSVPRGEGLGVTLDESQVREFCDAEMRV